jgi:hypothetical protein
MGREEVGGVPKQDSCLGCRKGLTTTENSHHDISKCWINELALPYSFD